MIWRSKGIAHYLIWPISMLYLFFIKARLFLFKYRILKKHKLSVPVVIVGNITVGGTGKTPLVIYLVQLLKEKGYKPGVLTRGYKGSLKKYPSLVSDEMSAHQVGDEPKLIHIKTNVPVMIDPNRVRGGRALIEECDCDVIICDDGLQHYALERDIEIAVIDGQRYFGNEFYLPAGPLREPLRRLGTVDFMVCNSGQFPHSHTMTLAKDKIYNVASPENIADNDFLKANTLMAIAGIGNPQRFFNTLADEGFIFTSRIFPDHHAFIKSDIVSNNDEQVIMTEKDAVKCVEIADWDHWCYAVKASLPPKFTEEFLQKLSELKA